MEHALSGWLGPMGAPQDFWYEESGFHEAKSIGPTAPHIRISSAHQLDEPGMELLVVQLPQAEESDLGAISLISLVHHANAILQADGLPGDELDFRLKRLGVDVAEPVYADTWFRVKALETFTIDEDFPAIRFSGLTPGIERVRYSLDRSAIAPFLTSTDHY
jgi:hypothetical protein